MILIISNKVMENNAMINTEFDDWWIEITGESDEIPEDIINKLIEDSDLLLGNFHRFDVMRIKPDGSIKNTKLYEYMMDHPRLEELIKLEIMYTLDDKNLEIRQKFFKYAADIIMEELGHTLEELEEFLVYANNRKSARNV